jgi:hypothetical protein
MFSWLRKNFTFKRKKYDSRINHHKPIINSFYDEDDEYDKIIAEEKKEQLLKQEKENNLIHDILKLDIFPDIKNNTLTTSPQYEELKDAFNDCYKYDSKTYPDQVHLYTDTHLKVIVKCMLLITTLIGDLKPEYVKYAEFENYIIEYNPDLIIIENTILLLQKVLSLLESIVVDMIHKQTIAIKNRINTTYFKKYIPLIKHYIKLYKEYIEHNRQDKYYPKIGFFDTPHSGGKTKKCKTRKYKRKKI